MENKLTMQNQDFSEDISHDKGKMLQNPCHAINRLLTEFDCELNVEHATKKFKVSRSTYLLYSKEFWFFQVFGCGFTEYIIIRLHIQTSIQ